MNFNKQYALFCGLTTITLLVMYFANYYDFLAMLTTKIQLGLIVFSVIVFILSLIVLIKNFRLLFSKDYRYTTIILSIISLLSMWFNQFLYALL